MQMVEVSDPFGDWAEFDESLAVYYDQGSGVFVFLSGRRSLGGAC